MHMNIAGSTALVTGANRGLGERFAAELVKRGARVYAGARDPEAIDVPGVTPVRLDITDAASIAAALGVAGDLTLLINNAGSQTGSSLLEGDLQAIRLDMDTHYFGTLAMIRAFAPRIAANGGGAILNVLSALSWVSFPTVGAYCAAKSAEWSLTNALRLELAPWNVRVSALHVGYMDTDMARHVSAPKANPGDVAALALDGVAEGRYDILADGVSRQIQAGLAGGVAALYPNLP
jgi:NAD(P)-dependent dehydrogenase (short-subunit alcohol dehydrogenase family)